MFTSVVRRVRSRRPSLECLESRALLSTVYLPVTTLADDPTGPVAGQVTLRDAITQADAGSAADNYVIKFKVDGTIALANALPDLANNITINGPGAENLTVQGDNAFTIFRIDSNEIARLSGLTITGGSANSQFIEPFHFIAFTGVGGGVFNEGTTTISRCIIMGNHAYDGGAGIFNSGSLTVISSQVVSNSTSYSGGGILNIGAMTVKNSVFVDTAGYGGAIVTEPTNSSDGIAIFSQVTISGCVFVNNHAVQGAAVNTWGFPTLISQCVFIDNTATNNGGGIFSTGSLTVRGSTFIGNSALNGGGIYYLGILNNTKNIFIDNIGGDVTG